MSEDNLPAPGQQSSTEPEPGNRRGPRITAALLASSLLLGACSSAEDPEPGAAEQTSYTSAEATNSTALPESTAPSIESPGPTDYATMIPEIDPTETVTIQPHTQETSKPESQETHNKEYYIEKIMHGEATEQSIELFRTLYPEGTNAEKVSYTAAYYEQISAYLTVVKGESGLTAQDNQYILDKIQQEYNQIESGIKKITNTAEFIELENALLNPTDNPIPLEDYIKFVNKNYGVTVLTDFTNENIANTNYDESNETRPLGADIDPYSAKMAVLEIASMLDEFPAKIKDGLTIRLGDVRYPVNGIEAPAITLTAEHGQSIIDIDVNDVPNIPLKVIVGEELAHVWDAENPDLAGQLVTLMNNSLPEGLSYDQKTANDIPIARQGVLYTTLEELGNQSNSGTTLMIEPIAFDPYDITNSKEALAGLLNGAFFDSRLTQLSEPGVSSTIMAQQIAGLLHTTRGPEDQDYLLRVLQNFTR